MEKPKRLKEIVPNEELHDIAEIIYAKGKDYSVIKDFVKGYEDPFILYIEKNLIKQKQSLI